MKIKVQLACGPLPVPGGSFSHCGDGGCQTGRFALYRIERARQVNRAVLSVAADDAQYSFLHLVAQSLMYYTIALAIYLLKRGKNAHAAAGKTERIIADMIKSVHAHGVH